jgi:hypothetical protein
LRLRKTEFGELQPHVQVFVPKVWCEFSELDGWLLLIFLP